MECYCRYKPIAVRMAGSCAGRLIPYLLYDAYKKVKSKFRSVLQIRRIRIHRIQMFLGLPDPLVRGMDLDPAPDLDLDPSFYHPQAKIVRKTLIPTGTY